MAGNMTIPKTLECPLCMDVLNRATLLACGHTFCLRCLLEYDRSETRSSHMACPLCRKMTALPADRVRGLAPNITVNALLDDIRLSGSLWSRMLSLSVSRSNRDSLTVLREIDLPSGMCGMARLSDDAVVIAYGSGCTGVEAFTVAGTRKPYLKGVGLVRDIVVLNDGRFVVSHGPDSIRIYRSRGRYANIQYGSLKNNGQYYRISKDKHDNVFAVNWSNEIYVFKGRKAAPKKVIKIGALTPCQTSVTSTGTIIASSYSGQLKLKSAITMYKDGQRGITITASREDEYLYAAVDSKDRVFVGRVCISSGIFKLTVYTVQGKCLTEQMKFNDLQLTRMTHVWHYMVCLTPTLLALANLDRKLYFIRVPWKQPVSH